MFNNIKIKIILGLIIIVFFTIITYILPEEEWGVKDFNIFERLLFCSNIHIGTFGYINSQIFPVSNSAKCILLIQRITSYIFRIILLI